jgi:vanillate/3-O-methylgallate O-demethylase
MAERTKSRSLQDFVDSTPDLVKYFYNETRPPHSSHRPSLNPAPPEWSNWRSEQRAWRETAVLFDQTHHMPAMYMTGPDAFELLQYLGVNSFAKFSPGKAKQYIVCNPSGQFIGECVLYRHDEEDFELISGMHLHNWVHYHVDTGKWNVRIERDYPTAENLNGRRKFRFGMDGPNAEKIFHEVIEGPPPVIPFFNHARVRIAGCDVVALRHGMAGHRGVELSGRFEDGPKVRAVLLQVGEKYGLRSGGTTTYFSAAIESGWMAYPPAAVYTGEEMRKYREWMTADSWEVNLNLGGSFYGNSIEEYYVTPWDLAYDNLVKFDHDFIGKAALEKSAGNSRRTAVSLVWDVDDIIKITRSLYEAELPYKYVGCPAASYSFQQNDEVRDAAGNLVGISTWAGYTINERNTISQAMVDRSLAQPGTKLTLTWGEPNGGSHKPQVERHRQTKISVTVAPKFYAATVRNMRKSALGES